MSEKRFEVENERTVYDSLLHRGFVCSWKVDAEELVGLLNSLVDENEQLRQELNDCEKFRHSVFKRMNELTDQLKEKEEDEKLSAKEIVELNKTKKELIEFNELGGDY